MNIEVKDQIKLADSIDSVFASYEQVNDDVVSLDFYLLQASTY